jgi:hypothetical protein
MQDRAELTKTVKDDSSFEDYDTKFFVCIAMCVAMTIVGMVVHNSCAVVICDWWRFELSRTWSRVSFVIGRWGPAFALPPYDEASPEEVGKE